MTNQITVKGVSNQDVIIGTNDTRPRPNSESIGYIYLHDSMLGLSVYGWFNKEQVSRLIEDLKFVLSKS